MPFPYFHSAGQIEPETGRRIPLEGGRPASPAHIRQSRFFRLRVAAVLILGQIIGLGALAILSTASLVPRPN